MTIARIVWLTRQKDFLAKPVLDNEKQTSLNNKAVFITEGKEAVNRFIKQEMGSFFQNKSTLNVRHKNPRPEMTLADKHMKDMLRWGG